MTEAVLRGAFVGLRHPHVGRLDPKNSSPGYIHSFKQIAGVAIVAYCEDADPRVLELAQAFDPTAHVYHDVDDLIAREEFDFAVVVLPANEVPAKASRLARAGKHIFMEKQFARTPADLAELARVVRENRVVCQAGYPWRFHPAMAELGRLIRGGYLGKPLSIEARLITTQVRPGLRDPNHFLYSREAEGGGILHMLGGHFLDLMEFLMGREVTAVQAMAVRPVGYIAEPLEDAVVVALEYANGAIGSLHAGYLQPVAGAYDSCLAFRGMEGWAAWPTMGAPELTVLSTAPEWSGAPRRTFTYDLKPAEGYGGQQWYQDVLKGFVAAIRGQREPAVTVEDALRTLQVIEACYESSRTGRRVAPRYEDAPREGDGSR
jgi:predicted dehydrogenase